MQSENRSEDMTIQLDNNDSGEDFVLTGGSAWLRVDKYSLLITNDDDTNEIRVKAFPLISYL